MKTVDTTARDANPYLGGARVGVILPSLNSTTEADFAWLAPRGISFHAARIPFTRTTAEDLAAMNRGVADAARLLATIPPDLVAYACTSGSFVGGVAAGEALAAEIAAITQCPVVTTSGAMVAALKSLGISRLALATPYIEAVTASEADFLRDTGVDVVATACLGLIGPTVRDTTRERIVAVARAADRPEAEAVFVSCTDLRAFEAVAEMEEALGKPVLTSNQVTLWGILERLGHPAAVPGAGRLLAT
ncbi:maleate cis-trans isomerase family protein [Acuticoccus mangrovi]|uniref:Aspartate/glutamate racemase family protein n=1 Tax=Acuticoccus mangrovi TaxID=2796142 RepID=A0A934IVN7_9HYPH|nr:aspartate/glutamate racemase family protein [Acuticoccus mangrovi]MBJ3778875.1 aspartate/glutamate racemase family protein [Acuticoccus mangrovi]